jgi:RHS repeat-associated protein
MLREGEVRYTTENRTLPTRYTYTGQYSYMDDDATDLGGAGFGLMFYREASLWDNARWYDPALGRFVQADTIIPEQSQGVQAWDHYAYVSNNPVRYDDPTGHCPMCISAAVGAAIGFGFSYVTQAIANKNAGMELSDALNINNMDKGELLVATVGGAVAGATMGLAAPALAGVMTSELGAYMIAGALSNAAAGAAESITEAAIEQSQDGSPS